MQLSNILLYFRTYFTRIFTQLHKLSEGCGASPIQHERIFTRQMVARSDGCLLLFFHQNCPLKSKTPMSDIGGTPVFAGFVNSLRTGCWRRNAGARAGRGVPRPLELQDNCISSMAYSLSNPSMSTGSPVSAERSMALTVRTTSTLSSGVTIEGLTPPSRQLRK